MTMGGRWLLLDDSGGRDTGLSGRESGYGRQEEQSLFALVREYLWGGGRRGKGSILFGGGHAPPPG